jgi:hypothetical protein
MNIPFVKRADYLDVIFDQKVAWRLHIGMMKTRAFTTFIRVSTLFKSE